MATTNDNVNLNINIDASNANKNTESLKVKIRQLREAMMQLRAEGKENTDQYKQMSQEAGRLQDIMGDVAAETKALADDNATLTATMQGMSTGIAVFSGLQSAAAMLGVEDENLLEVLTKLQAAQVLLNSVNTIAKNLNKDSALMIALRSKNTKALTTDIKAETSATVAGTAATKTFTKAQITATTGAKGLTNAVKGVGTAIKSVPVVGWILGAVGALTTLVTLIKELNDEEERGNRERENTNKLLQERSDLYKKIVSNSARSQAIAKQEKEYYTSLVNEIKTLNHESVRYTDALKQISNYTGLSEEYLKSHHSLLSDIVVKQAEYNRLQSEYNDFKTIQQEKEIQLQQARKDVEIEERVVERMRKEGTKSVYKYAQEQLEIKKYTVAQLETEIQLIKEGNTVREEDVKKAKDALYVYKEQGAAIERNDRGIKSLHETEKFYEEIVNKGLDAYTSQFKNYVEEFKEGTQERLNAEIQLIRFEDKILANKTEKEKKAREEEIKERRKNNEITIKEEEYLLDVLATMYDEVYNKQWREREAKIDELVQKFNDESDKRELEHVRAIEKSKSDIRIASAKEGSEEYFEALKERNDQEMAIELQDLADLHDCKLISDELYESEVDRIKAEHVAERQRIEMESLEAIQQQRNDVVDSFATVASQTSALVTDMMETELEGVEQGSKKEKQIRKKYAVAEATMQIADIGISTAQSIMGAWQSTSKLVYPLNLIMGGIMTAMLAMTGLAQTAKAMKSKQEIMKASRGMYISGRSHANGGEMIEAEGGEVIMSKRAVRAYGGLLSQMNSSVGGVRFPQAESNTSVIQTTINPNDLRTIVTEVVAGTTAVPVVVSERSISDSQARVASISSYARI